MSDEAKSPPVENAHSDIPGKESLNRVVVRAYPKVIFFWLTWVCSLVAGIVAQSKGAGDLPMHLGTIWMCIFAFNLLVISFDFSEVISVTAIALVGLFIFAGLYFDVLSFVGEFFRSLELSMNANFYYTMFGLFSIVYLVVFLKTRFDYWEFRHNEVIHRRGVFADIKRYSTEDLRWFKEVPDVLERILAGSGRMILTTPRETHPIVIEHVLGISRIDEQVADILGVKRVIMQ
ncbi:MAG: hypothetical protein O2894_04025 [Planctomycetota bacterium]|nr:hypothetical protein [Planctomycetota bacterium]